jgi:SAM-dependent methyltransferase
MDEKHQSRVRDYYDRLTPIILKDVGYTYQGGTLVKHQGDPFHETNIHLAERAGIRPGMRVLDAGCGACGPAVDIARHVGDIRIDAVTISEIQAEAARAHVSRHNLTDRIHVRVGDYHNSGFADKTFDVVYFFESSGYSEDPQKLLREIFRILKPGGTIYIKDVFSEEPPLTEAAIHKLQLFYEFWHYYARPLSEEVAAASAAGFVRIEAARFGDLLESEAFFKTLIKFEAGKPVLSESGDPLPTDFGRAHASMPEGATLYGEVKAKRP